MTPHGGGKIPGTLERKINEDFGGVQQFKEAFKTAGVGQFGSGWAWLVLDGGQLKVRSTANQDMNWLVAVPSSLARTGPSPSAFQLAPRSSEATTKMSRLSWPVVASPSRSA